MAKRSTSALEGIIRENVRKLLSKRFGGKPGRASGQIKNLTLSRIQEFLKGGGCSVAYVQRYADAFEVKPYQLLIKDLNIEDLPELISASRLRKI